MKSLLQSHLSIRIDVLLYNTKPHEKDFLNDQPYTKYENELQNALLSIHH